MAFNKRPMRRSALIGPWGVGAIVPFPEDESLMIAGLDAWRYNDKKPFLIKDDRLTRRLGVSELRWPPDFRERSADPKNCNLTIPAVRFPTWYYCPFCGRMKRTTYYETQPMCDAYPWNDGRKCSKAGRKMIPERFIVICPEGHIDDFPVAEWVHEGSGHPYNPDSCVIRRSTGGSSANLTGVYYTCTCKAQRSLSNATKKGALKRIGYNCRGARPWLGDPGEGNCAVDTADVKVVLRGATNVWFADTRSSISIPVEGYAGGRKIMNIVNESFDAINCSRTNGELDRNIINFLAIQHGVDAEELYRAFEARASNLQGYADINENTSEDAYRFQEYKVLCKTSGSDAQDFRSVCHPVSEYDPVIRMYFESISMVPKLRETRAFIGFSRVEPAQKTISEQKRMIRLGTDEDWLPAIEVYGEGIFFKFNSENLAAWAARRDVQERLSRLNQTYRSSKYGAGTQGNLRAEYVLIHTFAHLLINQLSFECGYGSSSIRERIYCERTSNNLQMYGVLIYTASGDSEGSMGGLVRQGERGRLEDTILNAIQNAMWCTSDPVCIQSLGQGPESLNLAACHNCALLPETCCETGNRLLDRGMVAGTLDHPEIGYFHDLAVRQFNVQ